jgi:DDE superfamily endonuclease
VELLWLLSLTFGIASSLPLMMLLQNQSIFSGHLCSSRSMLQRKFIAELLDGLIQRHSESGHGGCFLEKVANLKDDVILLDNRLDGYDGSTNALMSVDGTDCPTMESWPFDPKWYSHKFNGPGVKYEVGVCIKTGYIVWINGPFVASTSDATIFKNTLSGLLADDEGVEVDKGYGGDKKLKSPQVNSSKLQKKEKASAVGARHENVNSRLKIYNVLNIPFRHLNPRYGMMEKYGMCFNAIAVILTQLKFESGGERLYDIKYDSVNYF